jgi:hypothetical protein
MNISPIGIITIFLVITAVVFAGCTDSAPSDTSVTTLQNTSTIPTTTGTPQVTPTRQQATTADGKVIENPVKVFNGDYRWVEYRNNNTVTMPPNPRYQWEYALKTERSSGSYQGIPAIHYKITSTSDYSEWIGDKLMHTTNGRIAVSDRYYDISSNKFLGGTSAETIKGIVKPVTDLPVNEQFSREDRPAYDMGIEPFGEMNITLIYQGTESVTVPAGIYPDARKYTGNFRDGTLITFWVAPGIPVPVQYQFPNKYLDGVDPFQSYELKGWA